MGQLVFQATLGGTTALVGPNTAATNSLTIPNASGALAWSTSALTSGRVAYAGTGGLLQDSANLTFNGTTLTAAALTSTGVATFSAGTVSAPAITTTGDTNTGIFFPAADTIAFTEGGAESMRITSGSQLLIGTTAVTTLASNTPLLQVETPNGAANMGLIRNTVNANSGQFLFGKSRAGVAGGFTSVASGDNLGVVVFNGADGTGFVQAATIRGDVDGTPGTNDMPGRLVFSTTADGSATPTERMRIDSSGNVGIGISSPATKLDVSGGTTTIRAAALFNTSSTAGTGSSAYIRSANAFSSATTPDYSFWFNDQCGIFHPASDVIGFTTTGTERMRITSGGDLLVNTTSVLDSAKVSILYAPGVGGSPVIATQHNTSSGATFAEHMSFLNSSGTQVGYISANGTATFYSTSSDYRLKENIAPMVGALAKVLQLKPVTYSWKSDGSNGQGFIAHELQEVCPEAVTGKKDDTKEDGTPQYQGIDTSFLVATLTAALQEAILEIKSLEARLAVLESK
jgi:hypothetical protein